MNRRWFVKALAALPFVGAAFSRANAEVPEEKGVRWEIFVDGMKTHTFRPFNGWTLEMDYHPQMGRMEVRGVGYNPRGTDA